MSELIPLLLHARRPKKPSGQQQHRVSLHPYVANVR